MVRVLVAALLIVFSTIAGSAAGDVNMQEGNWETTIDLAMQGMPFPVPIMTKKVSQCLTRRDMVPNSANKEQK